MIDELKSIAVFAETVRFGSFRAAAQHLGLSPSVVSHHVSSLESRVGYALLYRSTRKLSLTHEGKKLYEHAQRMLEQATLGLQSLPMEPVALKGKLIVSFPSYFLSVEIRARLAQFLKKHPQLSIELKFGAEVDDIIGNGIDLAIRAGQLKDSALKCKKIAEVERKLVISNCLLKKFPAPKVLEDMSDFPWIKLAPLPLSRPFIHKQTGLEKVMQYSSRISVNSLEAMTDFTLEGLGVSTPPTSMIDGAIANGTLIELLPDWKVQSINLYAVWPKNVTTNSAAYHLLQALQGPS